MMTMIVDITDIVESMGGKVYKVPSYSKKYIWFYARCLSYSKGT